MTELQSWPSSEQRDLQRSLDPLLLCVFDAAAHLTACLTPALPALPRSDCGCLTAPKGSPTPNCHEKRVTGWEDTTPAVGEQTPALPWVSTRCLQPQEPSREPPAELSAAEDSKGLCVGQRTPPPCFCLPPYRRGRNGQHGKCRREQSLGRAGNLKVGYKKQKGRTLELQGLPLTAGPTQEGRRFRSQPQDHHYR